MKKINYGLRKKSWGWGLEEFWIRKIEKYKIRKNKGDEV